MFWFVLLALGCNRGVDVTLRAPEGATAEMTFSFVRTGRMAVNTFVPRFELEGVRAITVEQGGRLGEDTIVVAERTISLAVTVEEEEGKASWSTSDVLRRPEKVGVAVDRWVDDERRTVFAPDGSVVRKPPHETEGYGDREPDLDFLWLALRHAPPERIQTGRTWYAEMEPETEPGADDAEYRVWTLSSVDKGIALIEEVNKSGDPLTGTIPDEKFERRSMLHVDTRTGLPLDYRMRDARQRLLAVDVTATFTWAE